MSDVTDMVYKVGHCMTTLYRSGEMEDIITVDTVAVANLG